MRINWFELNPVVTYAVYIKCRPDFQFGPRIIFEHQFIYVTKGKGTANIQGRTYDIKEGDLYYYGPHIAHCFKADSENPFEIVAIHFEFSGELVVDSQRKPTAQEIKKMNEHPHKPNILYIGQKGLDELALSDYMSTYGSGIGQLMVQIANQYRLNNSMSAIVNRGIFLYGLKLLHHVKHQVSEQLSPQDHVVHNIKSKLIQHADLSYERKWLLQWSGYHEDYISRKFREKFEVSPHEFHLMQKIETAKDLIEHSDLSVTHISEKLNFSSIHYFSKAFRKSVGQSPMQYKKNLEKLQYN